MNRICALGILLAASACVLGSEGKENAFQIEVRASSLPPGWDRKLAFDNERDGEIDFQGTAKIMSTGKAEKLLSVCGSRLGDGPCLLLVHDPDEDLPERAEWDALCDEVRLNALKVEAIDATHRLERAIMEGSAVRESDFPDSKRK